MLAPIGPVWHDVPSEGVGGQEEKNTIPISARYEAKDAAGTGVMGNIQRYCVGVDNKMQKFDRDRETGSR